MNAMTVRPQHYRVLRANGLSEPFCRAEGRGAKVSDPRWVNCKRCLARLAAIGASLDRAFPLKGGKR